MSVRRGSNIIAGLPIIDGELNLTSTRPVSNSAITTALKEANNRIAQLEKTVEELRSMLANLQKAEEQA